MRALVTGITGFAGQFLAEHLVAFGDQVLGSTFQDHWSDDISEEIRSDVPLFEWNLAEPISDEARRRVLQFSPDGIYHLAAISVPAECGSEEPSELAHAVNVGGTRAVLELAQSLAAPARVLMISSAHVYAPVPPDHPFVTEEAPLGPRGAYGKSKLEAERICERAAAEGLDVVIVRAFQHSGPRQLPKFMLPEWAQQFAIPGDTPIEVVTLDSHVDLSDVRDVVRAYRLLMAEQVSRSVYNVGSGKSVRSGDVFDQLVRLTGRSTGAVERAPGPRQHPIADISRLARDTHWRPEIPLAQTIADTLADFRGRMQADDRHNP